MKVKVEKNKIRFQITEHIKYIIRGSDLADIVDYEEPGEAGLEIEISEMAKITDESWVNIKHWIEDKYREVIRDERIRIGRTMVRVLGPTASCHPVKNEATKLKGGGFIYLLFCENDGIYKIGKAKNVSERMGNIQPKFPAKTELLHYFFSENYDGAERELHKRYEELRVSGEWFRLGNKDVEYIKSIQDGQL